MANILICGGGGFIGGHLINRLQQNGHWVRSVDIHYKPYSIGRADERITADLRDPHVCARVCEGIDEVYQLAADMGGAGYIFNTENDAAIMHNSVLCNVNILHASRSAGVKKIFFSSSACVYPLFNQQDPDHPNCEESSAYPAFPDSEYGWEKLFSERLYEAYRNCYGIDCKIGRFHNVYGPYGAWQGGKEKAPAALCRKVASASDGDTIEIWGDGRQTRSFLYIDDCLDAVEALMASDFSGPVNIGSEEMISIKDLASLVMEIAQKRLQLSFIDGPIGVKGRNSDNRMIKKVLRWSPRVSLAEGLERTYHWIEEQVHSVEPV